MKFPKDVQVILERRYRRHASAWVHGSGQWPMAINLSPPSESEALLKSDTLSDWILAWKAWRGKGRIVWKDAHWRRLGTQSLPQRLILSEASDVAEWANESDNWKAKTIFRQTFLTKWPALESGLKFIDESEEDLFRLVAMLEWLEMNPHSNLYPRQIPVPGLDTKWLERRMDWLSKALLLLRSESSFNRNFFEISGLRCPSHLVRLRFLDSRFRDLVGGFGDLCASVSEIAQLKLPIQRTYIVENLQSGLAFDDIPNSVLFMGMGNGISALAEIPWIVKTECFYWGDIDTYGFSILNQVRSFISGVKSKLMDESTLCDQETLWGNEEKQYPSENLPYLDQSEQNVFNGLKNHRWKVNLRLEQERIPWSYAWGKLLQ